MRELARGHPRDDYDCVGQIGVEMFRNAWMFAVYDDAGVWAFATIHVGKRKKNIWEPYCNWTLAYTAPERRQLGYGRFLGEYISHVCEFAGCARLKSKVGSYLGLRLHWSLGHHAWGFVPTGEIQIDTPLRGSFPDRTPMNARGCTTRTRPLTGPELYDAIMERQWQPGHNYEFLCVQSSATVGRLTSA